MDPKLNHFVRSHFFVRRPYLRACACV